MGCQARPLLPWENSRLVAYLPCPPILLLVGSFQDCDDVAFLKAQITLLIRFESIQGYRLVFFQCGWIGFLSKHWFRRCRPARLSVAVYIVIINAARRGTTIACQLVKIFAGVSSAGE